MELRKISEEQKRLLDRPLPSEAISPHPTKNYLSTIKAIYVTERMNDVFGVGSWRVRSEQVARDNKMVVVKVTFEIPEYGIYYECYGGNDNSDLGDAHKGAITDALTKIGSWLGIGADVFKGKSSNMSAKCAAAAPDPLASARPDTPRAKHRITADMLDDPIKCDCLLNWGYDLWTASGYAADFDIAARLLKSYDADADVLKRYAALFNSYKMARHGK